MLAQVFKVDVLKYECGGDLKPVAAICDFDEAQRYVRHVGHVIWLDRRLAQLD